MSDVTATTSHRRTVRDNPSETIILLGDIHGALYQAQNAIDMAMEHGADTIVQLGDFGIWPGDGGSAFRKRLDNRLGKAGIKLYFVDGNHEDFSQLEKFRRNPDGTARCGKNISHLPRGFRWEWYGIKFLAMGGAHSVDRQGRTPGLSWWHQETITWSQVKRAVEVDDPRADVMFCHDSPTNAPNSVVDNGDGDAYWPREELQAAAAHRMVLQEVVDHVKPSFLFHGHYHRLMSGEFDIDGRTCKVLGLNEGSHPLQAMVALNLPNMRLQLDELEKAHNS